MTTTRNTTHKTHTIQKFNIPPPKLLAPTTTLPDAQIFTVPVLQPQRIPPGPWEEASFLRSSPKGGGCGRSGPQLRSSTAQVPLDERQGQEFSHFIRSDEAGRNLQGETSPTDHLPWGKAGSEKVTSITLNWHSEATLGLLLTAVLHAWIKRGDSFHHFQDLSFNLGGSPFHGGNCIPP